MIISKGSIQIFIDETIISSTDGTALAIGMIVSRANTMAAMRKMMNKTTSVMVEVIDAMVYSTNTAIVTAEMAAYILPKRPSAAKTIGVAAFTIGMAMQPIISGADEAGSAHSSAG
jgi:hypothetical protein